MILAKYKMSQNYSLFTLLERTENAHRRRESLETDGEFIWNLQKTATFPSVGFPFTRRGYVLNMLMG